jgi:integrase
MTGPRPGLPQEDWLALKRKAKKALRHVRAQRPRTEEADHPPLWAEKLFVKSELSVHESIQDVWARCGAETQAFHRSQQLEVDEHRLRAAATENLDLGSYSIDLTAKLETFRRIRPDKISMPPCGREPADGLALLEWPHSELFASLEPYLADAAADGDPRRGAPPRGRVALDDGEKYGDLLVSMAEAGMLEFYRPEDAPTGPANGLFAVAKGEDALRLILDGKPGNYKWDAHKLQAAYEKIIASDPARAAALGLDGRLMAMPDSAAFSSLPTGICLVALRDFSAYFYGIKQHEELLGSQKLPAVDGKAIGRAPGAWTPVMTVMSMGNWLSACLAQLIHRATLLPLTREGVWALRGEDQSTARREAVKLLRDHAANQPDNCARYADVPASLREELERHHPGVREVPDGLRVPADCFELEVVGPWHPAVAAKRAIELRLRLYHRGAKARFEVAAAEDAKRRGEEGATLLCLLSAYIDDEAQAFYDVGDRLSTEEQAQGACLMTLVTIAAGGAAGLRENVKKLRWPSRDPGKHLGVDYHFEGERAVFEVAPARRQILGERLREFAESPAAFVTETAFDNLLGNVCWAVMCRRPFLSIFRVAYRARHSPNRPAAGIVLTDSLREELLMGSWAMTLLRATSSRDDGELTMYDASGARGDGGRGGFGVCHRGGMTELQAAELMMAMGGQHGPLAAFLEPAPGVAPLDRQYAPDHQAAAQSASQLLRFDWEAKSGPWRPDERGQFKKAPPHINVGEAVTGVLAGRRASAGHAGGTLTGRRLLVGGDNAVACTCLTKGRSSSAAINFQCRRAAVTSFVRRVDFGWFWIPSKSNPADGPSRWWLDGRRRTRAGRLRHTKKRAAAGSHGNRREWIPDLWMCGDVHPHPGPSRRKQDLHRYCGRRFPAVPHAEVLRARGEGTALRLSVGPTTYAKYLRAVDGMGCFLEERGATYSTYADALAGFVNYAMLSGGAVSRGRARTLLTAVVFFNPSLREATKLAWKHVKGWTAVQPTKRKIPMPDHVNDLLALTLLSEGSRGAADAGCAALLAQHTYCRGAEISELRVEDVFLPGHPGTFDLTEGQLHLRDSLGATKGSRNGETVGLDCPRILAMLEKLVDKRRGKELLFDFGGKTLLTWLKSAQAKIGYKENVFVVHCWRHGGASGDRLHKRRGLREIQLRGRWKDPKTMKIYLNSAACVLAEVEAPQFVADYFADDPGRADRILRRVFGALPRE